MFGRQAVRLLRRIWDTPTQLAQELFAMFQPDIPLFHNAPITITNEGEGPGLRVRNFGSNVPLVIETGDEEFEFRVENGDLILPGRTRAQPEEDGGGGGGGSTFPGKVVSLISGNNYQVLSYRDGSAAASTGAITVRQADIHADDEIPADTWVMVSELESGDYEMQVPVWLE